MIFLNFIMIIPVLLMTCLKVRIKKMRFFVLEIVGIMTIGSAIIVVFLKHYIWLLFLFAWGIISIKKSTSIQKVSIDKYKLLVIEALLIPQIILSEYIGAKSLQVLIMIVPIVIMLISIGYICSVRNLRLSMDDIKNHSFNKKDSNIFIAGLTTFIVIILAALITSYVVINRMLIYFKKLKNMDKVTFVYKDSEKEKNEIKQKLFKLKNNIYRYILVIEMNKAVQTYI